MDRKDRYTYLFGGVHGVMHHAGLAIIDRQTNFEQSSLVLHSVEPILNDTDDDEAVSPILTGGKGSESYTMAFSVFYLGTYYSFPLRRQEAKTSLSSISSDTVVMGCPSSCHSKSVQSKEFSTLIYLL